MQSQTLARELALLMLGQVNDRDGGGADGKWSTAANWVGDTAPAATGDTLVFAGTLNTSTTNDLPSITLSASGSPTTSAAGA